jgi:hypothetical protein
VSALGNGGRGDRPGGAAAAGGSFMTRMLLVKNWSEFQHYKDRNPPWIKLHRALLDDYEFAELPDTTKAHLVLVWLFASQNAGRIPADPEFLQHKLGLQKKPNLQLLVERGFLIPEQDDSPTRADDLQDASNVLALARSREERREEREARARKRASAKHPLPVDFGISDRVRSWAAENQHDRLDEHLESFKLKCAAKGYQYASWDDAFMEAIRKNWAGLPVTEATGKQQVAL